MDNLTNKAFLSLVCLGIGHSAPTISERINWNELKELAGRQGLSAIIADGVLALANMGGLKEGKAVNSGFIKQWVGSEFIVSEQKYIDYRHSVKQLAQFYETHGFKLMVLKGYGLSLNYPRPGHRPCGDIDIWAFGKCKEADAVLSRELSIPIDDSHHHHTVFEFQGWAVENHYDFVNIHYGHHNAELERCLKQEGRNDSYYVDIEGQRVYLPSPNLHALFVLRHNQLDFASTSMNLRQLLDWGLLVEKHYKDIDWKWLVDTLRDFHMYDFFDCQNAICIANLGFDKTLFPPVQIESTLKDRVLNDMLSHEFKGEPPSRFFPRVWFKFRRWRANSWKYRLCFSEPRVSAFFITLWSHLLKPSSI